MTQTFPGCGGSAGDGAEGLLCCRSYGPRSWSRKQSKHAQKTFTESLLYARPAPGVGHTIGTLTRDRCLDETEQPDIPASQKQRKHQTRYRKHGPQNTGHQGMKGGSPRAAPAHLLSIPSCGAARGPSRSRGPHQGRHGAGIPGQPRQPESAGGSTGEERVLEVCGA